MNPVVSPGRVILKQKPAIQARRSVTLNDTYKSHPGLLLRPAADFKVGYAMENIRSS